MLQCVIHPRFLGHFHSAPRLATRRVSTATRSRHGASRVAPGGERLLHLCRFRHVHDPWRHRRLPHHRPERHAVVRPVPRQKQPRIFREERHQVRGRARTACHSILRDGDGEVLLRQPCEPPGRESERAAEEPTDGVVPGGGGCLLPPYFISPVS